MPRRARGLVGGYAYHVLNRADGRPWLFRKEADFAAFDQILGEAQAPVPLRLLGYVVMANHWQFVGLGQPLPQGQGDAGGASPACKRRSLAEKSLAPVGIATHLPPSRPAAEGSERRVLGDSRGMTPRPIYLLSSFTQRPLPSSHSNNCPAVSPVVLIAFRAKALDVAATCGVEYCTGRPRYSRQPRRNMDQEQCRFMSLSAPSIAALVCAIPRFPTFTLRPVTSGRLC